MGRSSRADSPRYSLNSRSSWARQNPQVLRWENDKRALAGSENCHLTIFKERTRHQQKKKAPETEFRKPFSSFLQIENLTSANHCQESRERLNAVSASGFLLPN